MLERLLAVRTPLSRGAAKPAGAHLRRDRGDSILVGSRGGKMRASSSRNVVVSEDLLRAASFSILKRSHQGPTIGGRDAFWLSCGHCIE